MNEDYPDETYAQRYFILKNYRPAKEFKYRFFLPGELDLEDQGDPGDLTHLYHPIAMFRFKRNNGTWGTWEWGHDLKHPVYPDYYLHPGPTGIRWVKQPISNCSPEVKATLDLGPEKYHNLICDYWKEPQNRSTATEFVVLTKVARPILHF